MLEKLKKFWPVLLIVLVIGAGLTRTACIGPNGAPVTNVEQMTQEDFGILVQEVYTMSHLGIRQLVDRKPELKKPLNAFVSEVESVLNSQNGDINKEVDKLIHGLNDPDVQDALQLAWLQVQKYGGLQYVNFDKTKVLTPRSAELFSAMLGAIQDVVSK